MSLYVCASAFWAPAYTPSVSVHSPDPTPRRSLTWAGGPWGASACSLLGVATLGLLELMSTGELISSTGRSAGECTMRFRVLRAVVMENGRRLFRRESGALWSAGGSLPFALGEAVRSDAHLNGGGQWLLLVCRSCLAVVLGWKRQKKRLVMPLQWFPFPQAQPRGCSGALSCPEHSSGQVAGLQVICISCGSVMSLICFQ